MGPQGRWAAGMGKGVLLSGMPSLQLPLLVNLLLPGLPRAFSEGALQRLYWRQRESTDERKSLNV